MPGILWNWRLQLTFEAVHSTSTVRSCLYPEEVCMLYYGTKLGHGELLTTAREFVVTTEVIRDFLKNSVNIVGNSCVLIDLRPGDPHLQSDFSGVQGERDQVGHTASCSRWKHLYSSGAGRICTSSCSHDRWDSVLPYRHTHTLLPPRSEVLIKELYPPL